MNVFELFAKLSIDKSEYEEGLEDAQEKTSSFGEKLKAGLSTAGKVGGAAVAAIGAAAGALATTVVKQTGDVAAYGDNIDKMSQKMGLSVEAYQEWDAVLQHSGTSIESMQGAMKTLANAVETGSDAFAALGLNMDDLYGMSQEDLFATTITALQNVEEETQRTYLASKLLGRGGVELGALLNTSAEDTQAMRDRVHELGGVMSEDAVKAAAAYQDSLQDMQTATNGVVRNLMSNFLPSFSSVMDGLTEIFSGNQAEGLTKINDGISDLVTNVTEVVLPKLLDAVATILPGVISAITNNLPQIAAVAFDAVSTLATGLIQHVPEVVSAATVVIGQLASGLGNALPTLLPVAVNAVTTLVTGLSSNIPMLIDAAMQLIEGLMNGLLVAIPVLIQAVPTIITSLIENILAAIPRIIQTGVTLITSLVGALPEIISTVVSAIPEIILGILGAIVDAIPQLIQAGVDLLVSLVSALPQIIVEIVKAIPVIITSLTTTLARMTTLLVTAGVQLFVSLIKALPQIVVEIVKAIPVIISGLVEALVGSVPQLIEAGVTLFVSLIAALPQIITELVAAVPEIISALAGAFGMSNSEFVEVGKNVIHGIWSGISSMGSWIGEKVNGLMNNVVGGVKSLLGIHSPSTVFAGMGKNMALGLGEGWENEFGKIKGEIEDGMEFEAGDVDIMHGGTGFAFPGKAVADIVINITETIDGAILARNTYRYNQRQNSLEGTSLVEV